MKVAIRVLAIICLMLMILALVILGGCVILQRWWMQNVLHTEGWVPIVIPASTVVHLLFGALLMGLMCAVAANRGVGIWSDIILVALGTLGLPVLRYVTELAQKT